MTDEQKRLLDALEPFRIEAGKAAYQDGIQQGILRVYSGMVNWAVRGEGRDITNEERHKRITETRGVIDWLESTYPIIRETYPKNDT